MKISDPVGDIENAVAAEVGSDDFREVSQDLLSEEFKRHAAEFIGADVESGSVATGFGDRDDLPGITDVSTPRSFFRLRTRTVSVPSPSMCAPMAASISSRLDDLGFAGGFRPDGFAVGQGRGHQRVARGADARSPGPPIGAPFSPPWAVCT